jgi:hypothetical protein
MYEARPRTLPLIHYLETQKFTGPIKEISSVSFRLEF